MPPTESVYPTMTDRRWAIAREVQRSRRVSVADLARQFGVSQPSIRRDLRYLEQVGLLQRVHGGAEALSQAGTIPRFEARLLENASAKRAIGAAACALVQPGDTILLDSGTTVLEIARHLPDSLLNEGGLTVVTRSLIIASELRRYQQARLVVLGGLYAHEFDTMVGIQVEQAMQGMHVDLLFTGVDGVTAEAGLTTDNLSEVQLYRIMARHADRVVIVTDSSKIGVNNLQTILSLDEIHTFITDAGAPSDFLEVLRVRGIGVVVVPVADPASG